MAKGVRRPCSVGSLPFILSGLGRSVGDSFLVWCGGRNFLTFSTEEFPFLAKHNGRWGSTRHKTPLPRPTLYLSPSYIDRLVARYMGKAAWFVLQRQRVPEKSHSGPFPGKQTLIVLPCLAITPLVPEPRLAGDGVGALPATGRDTRRVGPWSRGLPARQHVGHRHQA